MFGGGFRGFGGMGGMPEEKEEPKEVDNNTLYELLGVDKKMACEDIRRAFRRLALKAHPDKGGDPEKFKKLSEANEILSNPEKRDLYDQYGMEGVQQGGNPNGMSGFGDIFSFFGGGGRRRDTGPRKGKTRLIEINITLEQAYNGCMKTVPHKRQRICEKCEGKGGKDVKTCTKCKGRRYVEKLVMLGPGMYTQSQEACSECRGTGQIMDEKDRCKECKGKKTIEKEKVLEVSIQPGCPHEHDYIFTGESDEFPGIIAGDIYVRTNIVKHKVFERKGADLWMKKKITLLEALTGVNFEIDHLDGKKYRIATSAGEVLSHKVRKTVKGRGMPFHKDSMSHGNLYIEFEVEFPKKNTINPEKAKILKDILNVKYDFEGEVKEEAKKKAAKGEVHHLEDFSERDLNKNPKGGSMGGMGGHHHDQDDEDENPRNGRSAQCQAH